MNRHMLCPMTKFIPKLFWSPSRLLPITTWNFTFTCLYTNTSSNITDTEIVGDSFMYFGYGSNLLTKRLHIGIPSAERFNIGTIKDYRLDFATHSKRWCGSVATIVAQPNEVVWGAIWKINLTHLADLDKQEGVGENFYKALLIIVETPTGEKIPCRTYQQVNLPTTRYENKSETPIERQPSETYIGVIIAGAIESKLPNYYIEYIKSFPHNGQLASKEMLDVL